MTLVSREAIERELEGLGEGPLGDDESIEHTLDDPDVRAVSTLLELSEPSAPAELSELARRGVWRRIVARVVEPAGASVPASHGGLRPWRSVLVGLSVAAGIALWARTSPRPQSSDREALVGLAQEARAGLSQLDSRSAAERARSLAAEYGARLEGDG